MFMKRCKSSEMKRKAKRLEDEGCKMWWLLWMNGGPNKEEGSKDDPVLSPCRGEGGKC